jgi:hypothetical protein
MEWGIVIFEMLIMGLILWWGIKKGKDSKKQ